MTCRWLQLLPRWTLRLFPQPPSPHREYSAPTLHPELVQMVGSLLFSLLPLEFQIVLETGLAAYFELASALSCGVGERGEDTFC